jgi:O-glycosyl hydrolase
MRGIVQISLLIITLPVLTALTVFAETPAQVPSMAKPIHGKRPKPKPVHGGSVVPHHSVPADDGDTSVPSYSYNVTATDRAQTFEGWGMSLAWFGNIIYPGNGAVTDWDHWASIIQDYYGPRGLGFNIARYNIGGGENPKFTYLFAANSKFPNPAYMIEGFLTAPGKWNWQADKPQIQLLLKARELGANLFEAFSNSPPYFWLKSQSVTGASYQDDGQLGESGVFDNLKDQNYDDFADYLTEVVKHFRDTYGIHFRTLEPVNEPRPETRYWTFKQEFPSGKVQEGCHFSIQNQNKIQIATSKSLRAKGLAVDVAASDDTGVDYSLTSLLKYDPQVLATNIQQVNTHTYIDGDRPALRKLAADHGKRLWMSEFGTNTPDMDGALEFAGNIRADIRDLGAQAWIIWQPDWGLVKLPGNNQVIYYKEYYAMKQYSAFIRPGSVILKNSDWGTVSAYDPAAHRLVFVTLNVTDNGANMTANISGFKLLNPHARVFVTSDDFDMNEQPHLEIKDGVLPYTISAKSITTLVIDNVDL